MSGEQSAYVLSAYAAVTSAMKLAGGPIVDVLSRPGRFLGLVVLIAGLSNAAIALCHATRALASDMMSLTFLAWSINAAAQSLAWPLLAKVFMSEYCSAADRGQWYSFLSTSQTLGGLAAAMVLPPLIDRHVPAPARSTRVASDRHIILR